MSHKDKRLFNYVVNTLGISKDMIMEYVNSRIESVLEKQVANKLNSKDAEQIIVSQIARLVKDGFHDQWYHRTSFDLYVRQVIVNILEKKVNDEYDIETKLVRKDKQVIAKR